MKYTLDKFAKDKTIHFVGIGGIGMSAIAKILVGEGYTISGSDQKDSSNTIRLKELGVHVFIGHDRANVREAHCLVISSAIPEENPELVAARENDIPVLGRAEMLSLLMDTYQERIAVAGTHGKTTTSSLAAYIFQKADQKPTYVVGGILQNTRTNAARGAKKFFIAEADESDGSLVQLNPNIIIVTNIELDHLDHFENFDQIVNLFEDCIKKLPAEGLLIINADHYGAKGLLQKIKAEGTLKCKCLTYGFEENLDFYAQNIRFDREVVRYSLIDNCDKSMQEIEISIPGRHNVLNSLAVYALAKHFKLPFPNVRSAIKSFKGAQRRFHKIGEAGNILVYDDYAHHPTEIEATLQACRDSWPERRLVAVFQPHRYSRTYFFQKEFAESLKLADSILITDVYAANESPLEDVSGESIYKWIADKKAVYIKKKEEISQYLLKHCRPGDVVFTLGAGDIYTVAKDFLNRLRQKKNTNIKPLDVSAKIA